MIVATYEALAENIENELAAVGVRDFAAVRELDHRRQMIIRRLPAVPPPDAREVLVRCSLLSQRVTIELQRVRESILLEMAQIRHGQRAAHGYAPAQRPRTRFSASA